jgi:hypothetical protein
MNIDMINKLELNKKDKDIDKSDKWLILLIILVVLVTKLPNFFFVWIGM